MKVSVGDYFDMYKKEIPAMRVIVRDILVANNQCLVEDICTGNEYQVDTEYEIGCVIGNIFNNQSR